MLLSTRRWIGVCVAVALASGGCSFTLSLPPGLPSAATLAQWEKVTGDVETAETEVSYQFYVNPSRPGIYQLTRYKLTRILSGADGSHQRRRETEKLLWNARPDTRDPLVCYERRDGSWRKLAHGTPEYITEMHTAIYVYGLHRHALATQN